MAALLWAAIVVLERWRQGVFSSTGFRHGIVHSLYIGYYYAVVKFSGTVYYSATMQN